MSNLLYSVKVTEHSEWHFGLVTRHVFLLFLTRVTLPKFPHFRLRKHSGSSLRSQTLRVYLCLSLWFNELCVLSLSEKLQHCELILSYIEGENIKWAGASNRRLTTEMPVQWPPQLQVLLEPLTVDDITLELTIKIAKQGNVHRMTWASTVGLLQNKTGCLS